ncbi:hypothetical protein BJY52DRAFT_1419695 [Lactarius psammicola]|nr:hypothetical protein BJY52DRAFT_1419695 [Lactarius psammicola]
MGHDNKGDQLGYPFVAAVASPEIRFAIRRNWGNYVETRRRIENECGVPQNSRLVWNMLNSETDVMNTSYGRPGVLNYQGAEASSLGAFDFLLGQLEGDKCCSWVSPGLLGRGAKNKLGTNDLALLYSANTEPCNLRAKTWAYYQSAGQTSQDGQGSKGDRLPFPREYPFNCSPLEFLGWLRFIPPPSPGVQKYFRSAVLIGIVG